MRKYLIHVGLQDKLQFLWELRLFHYSYLQNVNQKQYQVHYCIAVEKGKSPSKTAQDLADYMPVTFCPDYTNYFTEPLPLNNKYITALRHSAPLLGDRDMIVLDSDIFLLPAFNEWYHRLSAPLVFEPNTIHRQRIPNFLGWFNQVYGCKLRPEEVVIAPSWIMAREIVESYLHEYVELIGKAHDKRSAVMCGKGAWAVYKHYKHEVTRSFLDLTHGVLTTYQELYDYPMIHYYDSSEYFNKREYSTVSPFDVEPRLYYGRGHHVANIIWDEIQRCKADGF